MSSEAQIIEAKQRAMAFAEGLAQASGMDVSARLAADEPEGVVIALDGADSRYFVGRGGQILDSLQYVSSLIVNRGGGPRLRVIFDADDYRARREQTLRALAMQLADQVRSTGQEAVLDPLSAMERRIVHQALTEESGIRTYSEGEEPDRFIIISPATD